jgi:glyoxylase-like metal-dependent hydrolase (beta-lactamase superfamily II)
MSNPIATGADDSYQVVIVNYGRRSTVKSDVYLNYPVYGEPDEPIGMDYFFWVVRNTARTILVDTGFSVAGGEARRRDFLIAPRRALEVLGVDPDSVTDIVLTHAHYDHAGNLDLFPNARITMAREEYSFWSGEHAHRTQFHHSVEDAELQTIQRAMAEGRIELFDDRIAPWPGIEVVRIGGHTPGQSVLTVMTAEGVVLLASDAIHYYEEYERDMPFAFVADLVGMYAGFDTIRQLSESGSIDHIVSGHDPSTLGRFTPMTGELAGLAATVGTFTGTDDE